MPLLIVQWALSQESSDNSDEEEYELENSSDTGEAHQALEMSLSNNTFIHGRTFSNDTAQCIATMNRELEKG